MKKICSLRVFLEVGQRHAHEYINPPKYTKKTHTWNYIDKKYTSKCNIHTRLFHIRRSLCVFYPHTSYLYTNSVLYHFWQSIYHFSVLITGFNTYNNLIVHCTTHTEKPLKRETYTAVTPTSIFPAALYDIKKLILLFSIQIIEPFLSTQNNSRSISLCIDYAG